jgi:hypothetical protein
VFEQNAAMRVPLNVRAGYVGPTLRYSVTREDGQPVSTVTYGSPLTAISEAIKLQEQVRAEYLYQRNAHDPKEG